MFRLKFVANNVVNLQESHQTHSVNSGKSSLIIKLTSNFNTCTASIPSSYMNRDSQKGATLFST